jgi:hypothetical protein
MKKADFYKLSKSFVEYNNLLAQDKKDKRKNALINTGMLPHENFNYNIIKKQIPNSDNKIFETLGLNFKIINLIQSLNYCNELIIMSNSLYLLIKSASPYENYMSVYNFHKFYSINEFIIHIVKKFIDEIISITYILKYGGDNITINSIGSYLSQNDNILNYYDDFKPFFKLINDIDNSIKHSYSTSLTPGIIGLKENAIVTFYSKNGKDIYKPKLISISMNNLTIELSNFYKKSFEVINELLA